MKPMSKIISMVLLLIYVDFCEVSCIFLHDGTYDFKQCKLTEKHFTKERSLP